MAEMGPLTSKLRYEVPAYIEEYILHLAGPVKNIYNRALSSPIQLNERPKYKIYNSTLEFYVFLSKYFLLKHYPNQTRKSLRNLPPGVFYNTIHPTENDLEWKLRMGPYQFREEIKLNPLLDNLGHELGKYNLHVNEVILEQLILPVFDELAIEYPLLNYKRDD